MMHHEGTCAACWALFSCWLGAQLAGAEARCCLVETEVREEVSADMADLLRGMEASYKVRPSVPVGPLE